MYVIQLQHAVYLVEHVNNETHKFKQTNKEIKYIFTCVNHHFKYDVTLKYYIRCITRRATVIQ